MPHKRSQVYINEIARALRSYERRGLYRLLEKPMLPGEWGGRYALTHNLAFLHAALYEAKGGKRHRQLARKYLLDINGSYHFTSVFVSTAYEIMRGTAFGGGARSFCPRLDPEYRIRLSTAIFESDL